MNLFGESLSTGSLGLYTGIVKATPVCVNPTNKVLQKLGIKTKQEEPVYVHQERTICEVWFSYKNTLINTDSYCKVQFYLTNDNDASENGTWYVCTDTCRMEYMPTGMTPNTKENTYLDYNSPSVMIAKKGQKELLQFLFHWLNLKSIGVTTTHAQNLQGNFKELSEAIAGNLECEEESRKSVLLMLGVKRAEGGNYQEVFTTFGKVNTEDAFGEKIIKNEERKKRKVPVDFSIKLEKWQAPTFESTTEDETEEDTTPNPNAWSV